MTATEELVGWAWGLDDVPAQVRRTALRHLLDGLGCALAAARLGEVPFAVGVARGLGGTGEATVIGGGRAAAANAALANGALVHALDFDDTHAGALVHATAAVLPAALAIGESSGATGRAVLDAAVAGLETVTRLGGAVRHGFHARGFHATSVCGTFAAALVAARLRGLDPETAVRALGVAGSFASGSLEFLADGSSTKQLHPGWSGHAGIVAAALAEAGATGPATILEGGYGLYRAYTGAEVGADAVTAGLGREWETTRITLKPYPVCQLSHASLDALRGVQGQVERVTFDVPADSVPVVCEPVGTKVAPRSPYEAKFSLQWSAAALLSDGELTVETFARDRLDRPEVRALAGRIGYRVVPFDGPAASAPGAATITLADGRELHGEAVTGQPLEDDALLAKLAGNVGDQGRAKELADVVFALDDLPDLAPLAELLR